MRLYWKTYASLPVLLGLAGCNAQDTTTLDTARRASTPSEAQSSTSKGQAIDLGTVQSTLSVPSGDGDAGPQGPADGGEAGPTAPGICQSSCVDDLVNNGACNGLYSPVGPDSEPVLDCILGTTWPAPDTFPAGSCANGNLLACYCGNLSPSQCLTALPADITSQCKNPILAGTGCDARPAAEQSQCVGQNFVNPGNATGRALAYIQCLQDNCPDICFAP